jgi:hypothetical protein
VIGILVGFLFVFAACDDDDGGYSLDDRWIGFGMYQKAESSSEATITMDNGDLLVPIAAIDPGWYLRFEDGDRMLVNYTILGDEKDENGEIELYFVRINNVDKVLLKGILDITPENEDSIGNDPIFVKDYWMTDSLVNFEVEYRGLNKVHFLNLVKEPGELSPEDQPIELELRHNANDDEESIPFSSYVSFSLNGLRIEGLDSVSFVITATDYDGNVFREEEVFDYTDLP